MNALVLGAADCLFHDVQQVAKWAHETRPVVIAVNDAGHVWPGRINHWVSLHAEFFPVWRLMRDEEGRNSDYETWTRLSNRSKDVPNIDHWLGHWGVGSSGLYAVTVAQHLGCKRVVLCGMPMDSRPHIADHEKYGTDAWPQSEVDIHREGWTFHQADRLTDVRSCSGWTRELLGSPEGGWLYGGKNGN